MAHENEHFDGNHDRGDHRRPAAVAANEPDAKRDEQDRQGKRERKRNYADDERRGGVHLELRKVDPAEEDRQKRHDKRVHLQRTCDDAHNTIGTHEERVLLHFVLVLKSVLFELLDLLCHQYFLFEPAA